MRRSALVTGASRGIGRGIARALAEKGWPVCVNYLEHRDAAESLAEELRKAGRNAIIYQADVSARTPLDDAAWSRMLAVNLTGPRNTVMAALPHMLTEKRGCIVNVSSIWGLRGSSCETAYAASKAGLIGLTRSLALELAPSGIRVNAVAPGCIATDMVRALGTETRAMLEDETPMGRLGTPEEIAKAVCFLASDSASFITGQTLTIDGGFIV